MRLSDWSSDVCSSDLAGDRGRVPGNLRGEQEGEVLVLADCRDRVEHALDDGISERLFALDPAAERCEELPALAEDDAEDDLVPAPLEVPVHRGPRHACLGGDVPRSEDRRAGKECVSTGRSRWWTAHY